MPRPPVAPPRRLVPGLLSAAAAQELNRWGELLHRLALEQQLEPASGSEPEHGLDVPTGFWAKIVGTPETDGRHAWQEVVPTFVTSGADINLVWEDYLRSSTTAGTPAYESSGGTASAGDIVWLTFSPDRTHFLFDRTPGPPGEGEGITVEGADSTPSYPSTGTLRFDEDDGFSLSQPVANTALVKHAVKLPSAPPVTPQPGNTYFDFTTKTFLVYDGTTWVVIGPEEPFEWPTCDPISWTEYQSRCENIDGTDKMVRYKRQVQLELVEGCLKRTTLSWVFDRPLASGVTCEGEEPPPPPPDEDCCPGETTLPSPLTLTFYGASEECDCLLADVATLTYDAENDYWQGTFSLCSGEVTTVTLYCVESEPPYFALELSGSCSTGGALAADPTPVCDPPCIRWTDLVITGCCEGTASARIGCGTGTLPTPCCDGFFLPETLTLTFVVVSGTCACIDGYEVELLWNGTDAWESSAAPVECSSGSSNNWTVKCHDLGGGSFEWRLMAATSVCIVLSGGVAVATSVECDPLELIFGPFDAEEDATVSGCCPDGSAAQVSAIVTPPTP